MTEVAVHEPGLWPTIVRRVHNGGLETMSRLVEGQQALCVFWGIEHTERDMRENGFTPEEGWKAIVRDHEELSQVFDLLRMTASMELVYLEPSPGHPDMWGIFEPEEFIEMLEKSLEG